MGLLLGVISASLVIAAQSVVMVAVLRETGARAEGIQCKFGAGHNVHPVLARSLASCVQVCLGHRQACMHVVMLRHVTFGVLFTTGGGGFGPLCCFLFWPRCVFKRWALPTVCQHVQLQGFVLILSPSASGVRV